MTTYFNAEFKCCVCEATAFYRCLGSTNTFGGDPDLDTRPAEMARSTITSWMFECKECGYVSPNFNIDYEFDHALLKSDRYINCDNLNFKNKHANRFYKRYLITDSVHDCVNAFNAALCTAWLCDDFNDTENAILCRKKAIAQADKIFETEKNNESLNLDTVRIIKADLMRRAEMFDEVISEFSDESFDDETYNKVIAFILKKAKEHDADCHTFADAKVDID